MEREYTSNDARYTPMGGETCCLPGNCCPSKFAVCASAKDSLKKLRFSFLNLAWHPSVLKCWQDDKCFDEIAKRMGYRFELIKAELPPVVKPGGKFELQILLKNVGWASMFNPRDVWLALRSVDTGAVQETTVKGVDPRRWFPDDSAGTALTHEIRGPVTLPSDISEGSYSLELWLPDNYATLRNKPNFAVRFANLATWDDTNGTNHLGKIDVAIDGPGESQPGQTFRFN